VIRDAQTGAALLALRGHEGQIHGAAFAPDQSRVVTAGQDRTAKIWDARTGALLLTLQGHADKVVFADFDATGQRVVTTSADATARVWDAATGALLHELASHGTEVSSAHFSADGSRIITAGEDRKAMLWSAQGERLAIMEGHADAITEAALSPDGQLAITACYDGTVGFWEAASGTLLWTIDLQPADARSAMLDATGALLLVTAGHTATLWDVAYDLRTPAAIQAFTDCRVDYTLQGSRLVRRERPPMACPEP
jgi:WD40 repeat protein